MINSKDIIREQIVKVICLFKLTDITCQQSFKVPISTDRKASIEKLLYILAQKPHSFLLLSV